MSENAPPAPDLRQLAHDLIDNLRTSGAVPGLAVGERAPDFVLPAATGGTVALADRLTAGPVVLVFYRGAWCPICNLHLAALAGVREDINALGASLIAISPQRPDDSLSLAQRLELGFDVLSVPDQAVIRDYRLQFELPAELRDVYRQMDMALDVHNADGSWFLPVPATFVVDSSGVVRAAHVDPNYRERMSPADIIEALRALR